MKTRLVLQLPENMQNIIQNKLTTTEHLQNTVFQATNKSYM